MQRREVHLHADFHYGPDDPMLWPQPWITVHCHLGAILRKPDDPNDPLLIMWWDPIHNNFKSFGSSLVDGLGKLLRLKFLSLQAMMMNLECRLDDYKKTSQKPNELLLVLVKAMQDTCTHLGSLKTTFSEMRFGVTEF